MKKLLLIFVVAMLTSGMAWARGVMDIVTDPYTRIPSIPGDIIDQDDIGDIIGDLVTIDFDDIASSDIDFGDLIGSAVDVFAGAGFAGRVNTSVVPMLSTEGRNTAGRFTGAADAFMNPRFHNPEMEGTFLFLGGDVGFDDTANRVHLGFARNLGPAYLGVYFGGGFVDALGIRYQQSPASESNAPYRIDARARITNWDVNFATLIGIAGMGIRLDIGIVNEDLPNFRYSSESSVEEEVEWMRTAAPSFALTWGANMGQLLPWARIGFQFAGSMGDTSDEGSPRIEEETRTTFGGGLEIAGGARFLLDDTSAVGGELWFGTTFRDRTRWSTTESGSGRDVETDDRFAGSLTGFGLMAYYQQRIEGGRAALGFRPNLALGFSTSNRNTDFDPEETGGATSFEVIGFNAFTLALGLDVGARWQATERITLLSGVNVGLFNWTTLSETGEDTSIPAPHPEAEFSLWAFQGVRLEDFNIGMTFAASDNILLGLRLNSLLDGLFGGSNSPNFDFTVTTTFGN